MIKSDPQMIGDLKGGASIPVNFNVKIPRNATVGTYHLPLNIRYTYLYEADQYRDGQHPVYVPGNERDPHCSR